MSSNLRAGLIGLGMMGRNHARVLDSLEGVDLVAVAYPGGDPHGVAKEREVLRTVREVIDAGIDYAVVAAPTAMHEEIGLELAAAGVHTMVEKPLAHTVESAERLADAFEAAGLIGAVGHIERFNPAVQAARQRLSQGELGDVYQVSTRRTGPFPGRIADVGVTMDLATHDIDLSKFVVGSEYETIAAQSAHRSGRPHEDLIAIVGKFTSGVVANHIINWLTPFKERTTIVTGERGAFVLDTLTGDLTHYVNGVIDTSSWAEVKHFRGVSEGDVTRYALKKVEPLMAEHIHFRDAIRGDENSIVTMREGLNTVRVAAAAIESGRTGESVRMSRA